MCNDFYDVQSSLGYLTITANRLMSGFFRKHLVEAGIDLTAEQWGVLAQLWNKGSISQDELAHMVCVDKSSISRVLDVMERKGLVARKRDPADARRKILYSTPEAELLKYPCKAVADDCMGKLLQDISPEDHAVCLKVLAQVKETIRALS
jgi:Transcriptional regulators